MNALEGMHGARPHPSVMAMKAHHISVCICTFKRPELLTRLLERLENQRTDGLFTYSVVVADNDPAQSARQAVAAFALPLTCT